MACTYAFAHVKIETFIFRLKIAGNGNNFDIVLNDFKSSMN